MKIAMIGPKRIPSREGGIDVVVGRLSQELVKRGQDVTVYVRRKKGVKPQKSYEGVRLKEVFTINKKATDALVSSFLATLRGLWGGYDVLHFHALGNTCFLFLTAFSKKKIVVTIHGIDWKRSKFQGIGNKILHFSEKMVVRYADEIITLCQNDYDYFRETYGLETTWIPNGFEHFPTREPRLITEQFGLHKEDYLLFLARIVPEKGLHYLIEAYQKANIPQKLVIAGGSGHSQDYYEQMRALAGDNPNILFTGFVQGELLAELYSNAYLYVLPSDIEGMPMSLLEALGYGRVCLVSDIRENRVDEENSYFFRHGDVADLQARLEAISADRKNYQPSGSLLGWDGVTQKTLEVYEKTKKK